MQARLCVACAARSTSRTTTPMLACNVCWSIIPAGIKHVAFAYAAHHKRAIAVRLIREFNSKLFHFFNSLFSVVGQFEISAPLTRSWIQRLCAPYLGHARP